LRVIGILLVSSVPFEQCCLPCAPLDDLRLPLRARLHTGKLLLFSQPVALHLRRRFGTELMLGQ